MVRKAWTLLLSELPDVTVVADVANGKELISLLEKQSVDIVLMDIDMPVMNGVEAMEIISNKCPWVKVIALTMQKELFFVKRLFSLGTMGYITKNASKEELFEAIQAVAQGDKYVCNELRGVLLDNLNLENEGAALRNTSLTEREIGIVRMITNGLTSKAIALELGISVKTVEVHRSNVFRKFNVKNVAEMIRRAREKGLV